MTVSQSMVSGGDLWEQLNHMIVIPMAERDNRFREAGYTTPGFMLTWRRKSLFFHVLDSFRAYFATERFLIVLQDLEGALPFVERELTLLGIPRNSVTVIVLENATSGQAEIVAVGLRKAQVPPDVPLTIFNIDAFRRGFAYPQDFDPSSADGYLEVFSGEGEGRSFVRPAPDRPDERRVAEISEKARVSDLRCTGLHHFRSCEFYLSLHAEVESLRPDALQGGECRIAFLHDRAARRGADIRYVRVSADDVGFFGTPSEYERRLCETPGDRTFAFCIGGQVRRDRRHLESIADLARRHEADVYISVWRKRRRSTFLLSQWMGKRARLLGQVAQYLLPYEVDLIGMFPEAERIHAVRTSEDCSAELKEIFPGAVIDVEEDDALDLVLDTKGKDENSLRMLYKIWRCNRLKRAGEAMRGGKYEGVVRFRPDIRPSLDVFTTTEMRPGTVVIPAFDPSASGLPDLFWACDSETDDRLSNLFGKAVLAPDRNWKDIHFELKRWTEQLSLTLKTDRVTVGLPKSGDLREQAFARSLVCDALRSGQYDASANLTREDAEILADLIECSGNPSAIGLTIGGLRSMYSAKRAPVVVRGILILALLISEPPYRNPALRHCADLILLTFPAERGRLRTPGFVRMARRLRPFLARFRKVDPNGEPLLRGTPDTRQPHDLWREVGGLLRDASDATGSDTSLDELVWTVHRDLLARLGEETFLTTARLIRDLD